MTLNPARFATIAEDGWVLVSTEIRHEEDPDSFLIPARAERESLSAGNAANRLFDIETREGGRVIERGIDRMWVIVKRRVGGNYVGVLESDPGIAEGLTLRVGTKALDHPPRSYVLERYGTDSFAQ